MTAAVVEVHSHASQVKTTLNMSFRTDYLTMVLYSPGPKQVSWRRKTIFLLFPVFCCICSFEKNCCTFHINYLPFKMSFLTYSLWYEKWYFKVNICFSLWALGDRECGISYRKICFKFVCLCKICTDFFFLRLPLQIFVILLWNLLNLSWRIL